MATKFADIAKAPKDLLFDDYSTKTTLKCKKNAGPVAVTIETERSADGALSSKVGTKFSQAKFNVDKAQLTASGGRVLETSMKVMPGVKVSFKANKGAILGVDYTNGNICATGAMDVLEMSSINSSACIGLANGMKVGGNAAYGFSGKTGLTAFNAGVSYTHGPMFASVTSASKFSSVNLGLLYKVNGDLTLASSTSHSSDKVCDVAGVGASYKAPFGTLKAKYGGGNISASFIKEIAPKVTLTASGTVKAADMSGFKYGVGIVM
eukprot:CAMPEP_0119561384 /NCGR_PEP_ID=MMETSP1352-20130426/17433_1 /TAXON_ID=265584 /ORGANISM="Stauroneis constricta, Strain CCMP1120" /LENGTH=264 /DNA_ID=CAMNT_0007609573 /DNA_START=98 /DNA_END=892 /DNA_ORIENTATION=+